MEDLSHIRIPSLAELLDRIPNWRNMSPIDVVTAVGKAEEYTRQT